MTRSGRWKGALIVGIIAFFCAVVVIQGIYRIKHGRWLWQQSPSEIVTTAPGGGYDGEGLAGRLTLRYPPAPRSPGWEMGFAGHDVAFIVSANGTLAIEVDGEIVWEEAE